jgi:hypothetical protein
MSEMSKQGYAKLEMGGEEALGMIPGAYVKKNESADRKEPTSVHKIALHQCHSKMYSDSGKEAVAYEAGESAEYEAKEEAAAKKK